MFWLLAFAGNIAFAPAAPPAVQPRCDALKENNPWYLSNLVAFNATPTSGCTSYICFHFCDFNNPGLEVETECSLYVTNGSLPVDGTTYHDCADASVRFYLKGDHTVGIERAIKDPCLGTPPYDGVTMFGHNDALDWTVTQRADGANLTLTEAWVPVTSEV